jgi:uncharacterized protein
VSFGLVELAVLIAVVAALYSSVGHGGASGYLAVLGLAGAAPAVMSSTALVLNVLVSAIGLAAFASAGHFRGRIVVPFLIASVPAAFLGGLLRLDARIYYAVLGVVLLAAAGRLLMRLPEDVDVRLEGPRFAWTLPSGAGIGLVSGAIGIGGGIFLSPLLVLARWATAKQAAAASACFILSNSLSGLGGRVAAGTLDLGGLAPLVPAALLGGAVGSLIGSRKFSRVVLCRVLAGVMAVAAVKLLLTP